MPRDGPPPLENHSPSEEIAPPALRSRIPPLLSAILRLVFGFNGPFDPARPDSFDSPLKMKSLLLRLLPIRLDGEMKQLLKRAEGLARSFSLDYVGVEHVFLSLRDLPPSHPILAIIARLPVDVPSFWTDLEREAKIVTGRPVPDFLPYTPRLQHTLRLAIRVAKLRKKHTVLISHFVGAVALEHDSLVAHVYRHHIQAKGGQGTLQDAVAQYFTLLMTFPEIQLFEANQPPHESSVPTTAQLSSVPMAATPTPPALTPLDDRSAPAS